MLRTLVLAAVVACAVGASIPAGLIPVPNSIIGGDNVDIVDYPYQLSMQTYGWHYCGASLIGSKYALTAAHCIGSAPANLTDVCAGTNYRICSGYKQAVEKIIKHPDYNPITFNFDLAILQFKDPFPFQSGIQPIGLPSAANTLHSGVILTISGYGLTTPDGDLAQHLQAADVAIVSNADCNKRYGAGKITDKMICAGWAGIDTCQGDSGGPMAGYGILFGVTSWGYACADPNYPGVYASVLSMRSFILQHTGI